MGTPLLIMCLLISLYSHSAGAPSPVFSVPSLPHLLVDTCCPQPPAAPSPPILEAGGAHFSRGWAAAVGAMDTPRSLPRGLVPGGSGWSKLAVRPHIRWIRLVIDQGVDTRVGTVVKKRLVDLLRSAGGEERGS